MPKSDLNAAVEKMVDRRIAKKFRECTLFPKLGAMIQELQEQNQSMKKEIDELKIMVRKLNAHGPTVSPEKPAKGKRGKRRTQPGDIAPLSPAAILRIRKKKNLTQGQMAALLGVKWQRYANWEQGRAHPTPEFQAAIRAIGAMSGRAIRSKLAEMGIFQTSGKRMK